MDRAVRGVLDLTRSVLAELDLDVVLDRVLESAQELTGARYAALGVLDNSRSELARFITRGIDEATHATIGAPPGGRSVLGALIEDPTPLRLADVGSHPRFYGFPHGHPPMRTFLGAPILIGGQPFGNLYLTEKIDGAQFSNEDQEALLILAELAGIAIDRARRYTSASQRQRLTAAEAERQRWARELHDDTLQSLSALRIGLSTAARSKRPEALRDASRQAIEQLEEGITNLRALITDLRPAALDELGAQAAVEALTERAARNGIEVDVSIDLAYERSQERQSEQELTRHIPELETAIYRIVQEALTNAAKHGHARRAIVEIHEHDETVHVEVRDDGSGFDPSADSTGFGLLGMRERVELLDGALHIDSSPGAGAAVRASFPVRRRAACAGAEIHDSRRGGSQR